MLRSSLATAIAGFTLIGCATAPPASSPAPLRPASSGSAAPAADSLLAAMGRASAERHPGGFGLTIPDTVHGFVRVSLTPYPDPRLGTHARYRHPDGHLIDAYVYPANRALATCGSACADTALHAEIAEYVGQFPEFVRRGYYRTLAVANEGALPASESGAWVAGRRLQMTGTDGGGAGVRSDMYLYVATGYKVKFRATYADDAHAQTVADSLASFAPAVVDAIARSQRAVH